MDLSKQLTKENVYDGINPDDQMTVLLLKDADLKRRLFFASKQLFDKEFFFDPENLRKFQAILDVYIKKGLEEGQQITRDTNDHHGIQRVTRSTNAQQKFFVLPEILLSSNDDELPEVGVGNQGAILNQTNHISF